MDALAAKRLEAKQHMNDYIHDLDFIEQQYEVPLTGELLTVQGVLGAARLIELASFCSERLHTFVYSGENVVVSTVRGASSLWYSIAQYTSSDGNLEMSEWEWESKPFVASEAESRSKTLPLSLARMPPILSSWDALLEAARTAPSCTTDSCDGVTYRHRVRTHGVVIDAQWSNPNQRWHVPQVEMVKAYEKLLALADLFPEEREEAERRRLRNRENRLERKRRKESRRKKR